MSSNRLAAVAFSFVTLASTSGVAGSFDASPSPTSFPAQLAETKSAASTVNGGTLGRTESFQIDSYIAQAESLYGLGSEKKAKAFLDVARGQLRLPILPWDMRLAAGAGDQHRSPH